MINVEVKCTGDDLVEKVLATMPKKVKKAASMSVNKTARSTRTLMARSASKTYFVTVGNARETINVTKKAGGDDLTAEVVSRGRPISFAKFKVNPLKVQHKGSKNRKLRVHVKRGSAEKRLDRAFTMAIGSGVGVFERTGRARFPVRKLFGPAVPSMLKDENIQDTIKKTASEKLNAELDRQIRRILK